MRALFVSAAYADPEARAKLRALAGLGHAIAAAIPEQPGTPVPSEDSGVRLIPIPVRGDPGPRRAWDAGTLRRAIADFAPALVQLEEEPWSAAAIRVAAIARRQGVTLVQYTAETNPEPLALFDRNWRLRVLRRARGVVAANSVAAERVRAVRPDIPVAVVPQIAVAPPPALSPPERAELALGFVGRLLPSKGLDLLLRALVHVHGNFTLTVVGTGPAQEQLEQLSARLGLASRVRWLGALPRAALARVWPEIDCLVLPARTVPGQTEATGRVVLEAMSRGIPAVVSASGALPETVGDGGLVVPEDDEELLRDAVQQLHDEPDGRLALGAAARRRVLSEYSPEAVAERTLALWEAVR